MKPDYQTVRKLIEGRFQRRLIFMLHFLAFMVAVGATAAWISTHYVYAGDWDNLAYLGLWGVIVFAHWLYYLLLNARDREIEAAWERIYKDDEPEQKSTKRLQAYETDGVQDGWFDEKPKRTLHEE
jgi:hypothetical protein